MNPKLSLSLLIIVRLVLIRNALINNKENWKIGGGLLVLGRGVSKGLGLWLDNWD